MRPVTIFLATLLPPILAYSLAIIIAYHTKQPESLEPTGKFIDIAYWGSWFLCIFSILALCSAFYGLQVIFSIMWFLFAWVAVAASMVFTTQDRSVANESIFGLIWSFWLILVVSLCVIGTEKC